jgi:ankyrin repeat protein
LSPSEFNASVRDSALDAIIAAIKAPDGFAEDLRGLAGLCTATWFESQVWDGLARVQRGAARRTHLMYAAWKGDVARVERLLTPRHARMRPAVQLELTDSSGRTALDWAALGGSADTVRFLLGMGARVGSAVLVTAAEGGNVEIFGMLLSGASAALVARMADPAYDRRADIEIAKAWCPQRAISADMIERDVDARSEYGWTLLMCAASAGNMAVAEALIRAGADVNAKENVRPRASLPLSLPLNPLHPTCSDK